MSLRTLKAFASLHDDYAFFEQHVDETKATLKAWLPLVKGRWQAPKVLDFGSGSGTFTSSFLEQVGFGEGLRLTLVEPDPGFRSAAQQRLAPFSSHPIEAWPLLDSDLPPTFDLIFSHHVLYYVPNLEQTLHRLRQALNPGGLLLMVQGGKGNGMNKIVFAFFDLLGVEPPYRYSEETKELLSSLGIAFELCAVRSTLDFPDTLEGRRAILRFLLGEHNDKLPEKVGLELFEPFVEEGRIRIESYDELFVVEA